MRGILYFNEAYAAMGAELSSIPKGSPDLPLGSLLLPSGTFFLYTSYLAVRSQDSCHFLSAIPILTEAGPSVYHSLYTVART